jgi:hypothetical protein
MMRHDLERTAQALEQQRAAWDKDMVSRAAKSRAALGCASRVTALP